MLRETVARHLSLSMLCESTSSRNRVLRVVTFQHKSVHCLLRGCKLFTNIGKGKPKELATGNTRGTPNFLGAVFQECRRLDPQTDPPMPIIKISYAPCCPSPLQQP